MIARGFSPSPGSCHRHGRARLLCSRSASPPTVRAPGSNRRCHTQKVDPSLADEPRHARSPARRNVMRGLSWRRPPPPFLDSHMMLAPLRDADCLVTQPPDVRCPRPDVPAAPAASPVTPPAQRAVRRNPPRPTATVHRGEPNVAGRRRRAPPASVPSPAPGSVATAQPSRSSCLHEAPPGRAHRRPRVSAPQNRSPRRRPSPALLAEPVRPPRRGAKNAAAAQRRVTGAAPLRDLLIDRNHPRHRVRPARKRGGTRN